MALSKLSGNYTGIREPKVAIIDSGVDQNHPDIEKLTGGVGIQVSSSDQVMYSDDYSDCAGHGTACAGIIRKKAPEALLYGVRIFDETLMTDGRALIVAIQWCIDNKMDVVNLSLGTTDVTFREQLREVCRKACKSGLILVAAESNDGRESYPAIFPEVIGVTGGAIHEPDGFYYRKHQPIECIARGDEQRVCWLGGKHIMISGTSFATPHITGIIARILQQHPKSSIQNIRFLLQREAIKEQSAPQKTCTIPQVSIQDNYDWIKKAVLYPYNKEMHSLVRYRDLLNFEIVGIGDPVGKGLVGKDAGKAIGEPNANIRISPNIREVLNTGDTLILGYVDQLTRIHKRDLLREYVALALESNCNVFCFQKLHPDIYPDLYALAKQKGLHIAYPHVSISEISQAFHNFKSVPAVDVPVLSVMGTSSQQGKFTLQLALRRKLIQMGYRVGQLGTEHHAKLFGMDVAFPMGYASPLNLPLQYYAPYLDYKMREVCQHKHPDIILTGSQSGTIPYDVTEHSTHSMSSIAFLLGVKTDACILVVNSIDATEYIRDTIDGIRTLCKAPTIVLAMGNIEKHIRSAYGRTMLTPQKMKQSDIKDHLQKLEDIFQLPAIEILSESGQQRLTNTIIQHFSKEKSPTAISA